MTQMTQLFANNVRFKKYAAKVNDIINQVIIVIIKYIA